MIRLRASDLGLACALIALTGCARPDATFDAKVHDYLLRHPEVVQEAMAALQKKQEAQAAGQAKVAIALNRQAIEHDPRDFVANPGGRITMTEFYDYRCPHCINIAPAVLQIIHDNPNVRVVFKEMPIFGGASDKAAAVALAVKKAGGDYLALYHDFMAARPLDDAAVSRIARAHGVDPATLDAIAKSPDAAGQIASVRKLAETLGIDGTPAFVIGDTMISGEDVDGVHAALATAQKETKH
jgi:protein-disulfide isomerase